MRKCAYSQLSPECGDIRGGPAMAIEKDYVVKIHTSIGDVDTRGRVVTNVEGDIWDGYGRISYSNADYYEGHFVNGKYDGEGYSVTGHGFNWYSGIVTYKGAFKYNEPHGCGVYTCSKGDVRREEGNFLNGDTCGGNVITCKDGKSFAVGCRFGCPVGKCEADDVHLVGPLLTKGREMGTKSDEEIPGYSLVRQDLANKQLYSQCITSLINKINI